MGRYWRRIGSAMAIAALVAAPSVMSACVALCAPVAAGPGTAHAGHGAVHAASPPAVAETGRAVAHAGHVGDQGGATATYTQLVTWAGHDCCGSDGAVLLTATLTRPDRPGVTLAAPVGTMPSTALPAFTGRHLPVSRPIPPPSPPPAPLVLRI